VRRDYLHDSSDFGVELLLSRWHAIGRDEASGVARVDENVGQGIPFSP
jgi:hypothetical protein